MQCSHRFLLRLLLAGTCVSAGCSDHSTDVQQARPYFATVDAGDFFTCGVTTAGPTVCWGTNKFNQLGRGTAQDSSRIPAAVATSATFVQINVGVDHSCGLDRSGNAYCWGIAASGLGTGVTSCLTGGRACGAVPTRVETTVTFSAISAGAGHTCGLDTGGFGWCWGGNAEGELGTGGGTGCGFPGSFTCQPTPVPVSGQRRFVSISAGSRHTCAITDTRDGYCWGYGRAGQLGTGAFQNSNVPVPVTGGLKFASIVAAPEGDTTCGLTGDGVAYCWGIPINAGSLKEATAVPTAVAGGVRFKQLSLGGMHACGIATTGGAYCWGDNYLSTIGEASRDEPAPVASSLNLTSISTSFSHTCGLDGMGEVYCWGDGSSGELGSGADRPTKTPVRVVHP